MFSECSADTESDYETRVERPARWAGAKRMLGVTHRLVYLDAALLRQQLRDPLVHRLHRFIPSHAGRR